MATFDREIEEWIDYLGSEKGLSQNTIEAYRRDVLFFAETLLPKSSFTQAKTDDIVVFLARKKGKGAAISSICRALVAVKVLFRFLKREGLIETNCALYPEGPKMWQLIPEVLTYEEVEQLLAAPCQATELGARDKAILELLYASGLRVSELCCISIYDVSDTFVKVMGKGRVERVVPVGKKAMEAIDHYLNVYRCKWESEKKKELFVTSRGRPIDRIFVWKMIKQRAREAGIVKNISPHTLRHSFATHLLDNGAELRVIQEMLGHVNIRSTDRYTHITMRQLSHTFHRLHPRK